MEVEDVVSREQKESVTISGHNVSLAHYSIYPRSFSELVPQAGSEMKSSSCFTSGAK